MSRSINSASSEIHSVSRAPVSHSPSSRRRARRRAPQPSLATRARSAATWSAGASVRSRIACQRIAGSASSSQSSAFRAQVSLRVVGRACTVPRCSRSTFATCTAHIPEFFRSRWDAAVPLHRIMCDVRSPALLVAALFFSACMNAATAPSPTPQQSVTAETRPTTTPPSPTATTAPLGRAARLVTAAGDFPLLSPDGTTLVSKFQGSKGGPTSALVFQSVDGRTLRRIPDDRASGQMQWLPDSSGVFVELAAGQRAGPLGIISVDGVLETGLDYPNPALSPDGKWIAAEHQEGCCAGIRIREIWVAPRSGGARRTLVTSATPQDV